MNTTPVDDQRTTLRYLPGLDGLRAISVLAVMVFHHYLVGGSEEGWAPGGYLGVEVFFVVSGYLITSLLLTERRETGAVSYKQFYARRARRLLPALWALLAIATAGTLLFLPDAVGALKGDVLAALFYVSNWWQIVAGHSYFIDVGRPELLKHLWSLAIEEQYYLLWPLLLMVGLRKLGRRRLVPTLVVVAVLSTLLMGITAHHNIDFAYYSTFTRLSGLLLGSVFAFSFAPYRIRGLPGHGARLALDAAGIVGLLFLFAAFGVLRPVIGFHGFTFPATTRDSLAVFQGGFLLVDLATLLVIAAAVHPASDVGRMLGWKPLQWTGRRSYSLYLWHYPIFCVTRPRLDFRDFFHLHGWPVFALRLGLSFAAAELSYRYIESPMRNGALGRYRERLRNAQGEPRRRLARRGAFVAGSLTIVAAVLGTGLANATPTTETIPGIDTASHLHDNGASADPCALAALTGVPVPAGITCATTTTVAPTTTVATPPAKHGKGARTAPKGSKVSKSTTTTTTRPHPPAHVLAIGDSVLLGASSALVATIPGIVVDGKVSRQFWDAPPLLQQYKALGALPGTIVIHLGTNGHITDAMFDQIMQTIGPGHQVYFLTARVPRGWESEVNGTLHAGAKRWANAHVLEWHDFAGCHDDWFVADGFHLRTPGQHGYAQFVQSGISGHPLTKCTK